MDLELFTAAAPGSLVDIFGGGVGDAEWRRKAFVPDPLESSTPEHLSSQTYRRVSEARAALASLDSIARFIPNPALFRAPTLRQEAQSTSELEGTYAPLREVLTASSNETHSSELQEVLNYAVMAEHGFERLQEGYPLNLSLLTDLHGILMGASAHTAQAGKLRGTQVVIGVRDNADPELPGVQRARFVPIPPGAELEIQVRQLLDWLNTDHSDRIDPVIVAAMGHYQFETLHPFSDGNGRLGRYLIVTTLHHAGAISDFTLTVSPWFEKRRAAYYDALLGVSTRGDWDTYIGFFAKGIAAAAADTERQMQELHRLHRDLQQRVTTLGSRSALLPRIIDRVVSHTTVTVAELHQELQVTRVTVHRLLKLLVQHGVLAVVDPDAHTHRYYAPEVLELLLRNR